MASNRKVMVLPGDGIGAEVMQANMKIIDWLAKYRSLDFDMSEGLVGGVSYDAHGTPLTDEVLADCVASDAVLFGAVGGPQYDNLAFDLKPERGLLNLRKEMDLFANLRPAIVFPALVEASTLKPEVVSGLDIMILRELCGGSYFAEPRGIDDLGDGIRKGYDTNAYTTPEIERIGDLLSECAAMLTGSLGMLPSASLGTPDPETGLPKAMYEPVHGSAPDIAGQDKANPLAQFMSFSMMLRYSFDQVAEADLVDQAVNDALSSKRTGDIMAPGCEQTGTAGMTAAVIDALDHLAR